MLAACTSRPPTQLANTATVTVDGNDTKFNVVRCGQLEWTRTINIGSDFAGAKVMLDQRAERLSTESVHIQNVGGFTGMYSRGDDGNAETSLSGERFTITGTAHGHKAGKPEQPATASFKIVTTC